MHTQKRVTILIWVQNRWVLILNMLYYNLCKQNDNRKTHRFDRWRQICKACSKVMDVSNVWHEDIIYSDYLFTPKKNAILYACLLKSNLYYYRQFDIKQYNSYIIITFLHKLNEYNHFLMIDLLTLTITSSTMEVTLERNSSRFFLMYLFLYNMFSYFLSWFLNTNK